MMIREIDMSSKFSICNNAMNKNLALFVLFGNFTDRKTVGNLWIWSTFQSHNCSSLVSGYGGNVDLLVIAQATISRRID